VMWVMILWSVLVVAALLSVAWLFPWKAKPTNHPESGQDPITVLHNSLARGEITREAFEQLKRDIQTDMLHGASSSPLTDVAALAKQPHLSRTHKDHLERTRS
jgi:hypothetical protein